MHSPVETPGAERKRYDAAMVSRTPNLLHFRRPSSAVRAAGRALLAAAAIALAFGAGSQELGNGVLLVAGPDLNDPNFSHGVVLVLQHGDAGTIGVVLNRPTSLQPAKVFPELEPGIGTYTGTLFRGGPVGATRLVFLVRGLAAATVQGPEIVDKVFLSGAPESLGEITRLASSPDELRMYAGHAEWAAGQLDNEIRNGAWQIVAGTAELVFADPRTLWEQLSTRGDEVVADAR
jgi:putative transcriptional regulator